MADRPTTYQTRTGVSRGTTDKQGHDSWFQESGGRWRCLICQREGSRLYAQRRKIGAVLDRELLQILGRWKPADSVVLLPVDPIVHQVELWQKDHRQAKGGETAIENWDHRYGLPAGTKHLFGNRSVEDSYRDARKRGTITVEQADPMLEALGLHGRQLWGDEYDRAIWGGVLPAGFQRSTDVRRLGLAEQARASLRSKQDDEIADWIRYIRGENRR